MNHSSSRHWLSTRSFVVIFSLILCSSANGHFIWLAPCTEKQSEPSVGQLPTSLQVFFGEEASPDDPDLLEMVKDIKVWRVTADSEATEVDVRRDAESLAASLTDEEGVLVNSLFVASHDLGVRDKGGEAFRLVYYAKSGPFANAPAWQKVSTRDKLALDVIPTVEGGRVELIVQFAGTPAKSAEVKAVGPGLSSPGLSSSDLSSSGTGGFTGETDTDGKASFAITQAGRYSLRVRHIESISGKVGDMAYESIRHYATVTLDVPPSMIPIAADQTFKLPELPITLTSFGGAIVEDEVYIYGGTKGSAHDYYKGIQSGALMRLNVSADDAGTISKWETISEGTELQGLAMVAHGGKLYRIGGFEARNLKGEDDRLFSVNTVASFDPATSVWNEIAPLPEPRSSFDAAVIGDVMYVVGGWSMQGEAKRVWHETAWKLDLSKAQPTWQPIANAPFERRALALAAHGGKLYAVGGISSGDETVRDTDVYDPATDRWTNGPALVGTEGIVGFGASAFATGGALYVSTVNGSFQRLSDDGSAWKVVGETPTARFFHRMLPIDERRFVMIGGSNMKVGRIKATEVFSVP